MGHHQPLPLTTTTLTTTRTSSEGRTWTQFSAPAALLGMPFPQRCARNVGFDPSTLYLPPTRVSPDSFLLARCVDSRVVHDQGQGTRARALRVRECSAGAGARAESAAKSGEESEE